MERKLKKKSPSETAASAAAAGAPEQAIASLRESLLDWYRRVRRPLPWRETRDPYAVLVSEVMLQQTQVATVLPHYGRFLERFPTVEALAGAAVEEVLAAWSGLGYYRRARRLHAAARELVARGDFPRTPSELGQLPGVGAYTAAAVASIAFDEPVPVVDGNVERVLARVLALPEDPKRRAGRRQIEALADALLEPSAPGDSNQALMELGATVCRPTAPLCRDCPLRDGCRAAQNGEQESYPRRTPRRRSVEERWLIVVVERGGRLLLFRRRDEEDLLGGLWELPWVKSDEKPERRLTERYGGRFELGPKVGRFRHGITFRRLEVEVFTADWHSSGGVAERGEAGWFDGEQIQSLGIPALVTKAIRVFDRAREELP